VGLLHDHVNYYLVVTPQPAPENQNEQIEPNVMHGLLAVPAGGKIYAFDRTTGKLNWDAATLSHPDLRAPAKPGSQAPEPPIRNIQLLLERFDESPVIILTIARQRQNRVAYELKIVPPNPPANANDNKVSAVTVAIDKVTGKMIHAM